jgi:hypothetical protein
MTSALDGRRSVCDKSAMVVVLGGAGMVLVVFRSGMRADASSRGSRGGGLAGGRSQRVLFETWTTLADTQRSFAV